MEITQSREPWNKGKLIGQKPPLKLKDIWAIRIHLQLGKHIRDLAMFNLAIDSKLRGCDLVNLRVRDVTHGNHGRSWHGTGLRFLTYQGPSRLMRLVPHHILRIHQVARD